MSQASHLLHIGYPKAGSSYLQRWFEAHPQIAYVSAGLAGFRDVYSIARAATARNSDISCRVTSCESLSSPGPDAGNASVDYERYAAFDMADAQSRACSTLAALFPGAKVLIVTRGFRSVIRSALSQYARSGGDADVMALLHSRGNHDLTVVYHYDRLIGEYRRAFGTANVILVPYELLRDDPETFIRIISLRAGIDPVAAPLERVNEGISPVELYWYPRLTRFVRRVHSRRLLDSYIAALERGRLRSTVALLQRLRPGTPVTTDSIPEDFVEAFRGHADSLRDEPLYAPYAAEYLHG